MTKQEDFTSWYSKTMSLIERQIREIKGLQERIVEYETINYDLRRHVIELEQENTKLKKICQSSLNNSDSQNKE